MHILGYNIYFYGKIFIDNFLGDIVTMGFFDFLREGNIAITILDFYITFLFVLLVLRFILTNKKTLNIFYSALFIILIYLISLQLGMEISSAILNYVVRYGPIIFVIILAPEIRKAVERLWKKEITMIVSSINQNTKENIADAVFYLANRKIGAIITLENHTSLDQYAEKAIEMDAKVTKELLINIFTPLTPLHDGAVIIRNDKVRCAAAYYVLTQSDSYDKTIGARHRAALGISEVSDSLTIVVSEETGDVSITTDGIMMKINSKEKLIEFIDVCLK